MANIRNHLKKKKNLACGVDPGPPVGITIGKIGWAKAPYEKKRVKDKQR